MMYQKLFRFQLLVNQSFYTRSEGNIFPCTFFMNMDVLHQAITLHYSSPVDDYLFSLHVYP